MSAFNEYRHVKKSRKEFTCVCCNQKIPVGSSYVAFVGIWEGDFQNWKMCNFCEEFEEHFQPDWSEGISSLQETLDDNDLLEKTCKQCGYKDLDFEIDTQRNVLEIECCTCDCDYKETISLREYLGMAVTE